MRVKEDKTLQILHGELCFLSLPVRGVDTPGDS